jgi:phage tail protein X
MLSPVDRAAARPVLENMRAATRNQIDAALLGAYGVVTADEKVVDVGPNLSDHFQSLKTGLAIAPPTKANLRDALDQVLDQTLRHTYPGAPDLGTEVKPGEVRKVAD